MAEEITIIFPDGAEKNFPAGTTGEDIAASISPRQKKQALAIKLDGEEIDLRRQLAHGGKLEVITYKNEEGIDIMRHSTAHLMAQAIKRLFKDVRFGVGPVIEEGFYYDMDMEHKITPEDLPEIEKEMKKIVDEALEIKRLEVSRDKAKEMFKDDHLKQELIDAIDRKSVV